MLDLIIDVEQEASGRWIADVPALPGVMCYAAGSEEARRRVVVLALRVLADEIEHGERTADLALAFRL